VTDDQKRAAVAAELARGDDAVEEAELLLGAGKLAGSVSRAYYGAFHYARALLLSVGEQPRTHAGLTRVLQRDFARAGRMPPEVAALLSRLMTFRQDADYTAEYVFTVGMAQQGLADARAFIASARVILVTDGWIATPSRA
jgi:uncharacterized protein (UPF0332 family)